jgi:hypothetical protein
MTKDRRLSIKLFGDCMPMMCGSIPVPRHPALSMVPDEPADTAEHPDTTRKLVLLKNGMLLNAESVEIKASQGLSDTYK